MIRVKDANLKYLKGKYCISVITACELINGAKNIKQRVDFLKVLRYYQIALVDEKISEQAFSLYNEDLRFFIAATAIEHDFLLYTDNNKDFNFIEGLKFYKEK